MVVGIVDVREVKCLYLGLSDIPAMLNSSTVHTLDLSNNEISILKDASFSSYSRLSSLILSYNKVGEIEINAFAGLQMMGDIDLSYNKLQSFNPNIFSSSPELEHVTLRRNNLVNLSSDCPILISASISSLDLSFCSLTTINPITFSRLPSLHSLYLSSNKLQIISVRIFEKLPDLSKLELSNNPWTCDCSVKEVMQWLTAINQQLSAHIPVKCVEGQSRTSLTVADGSKPCCESKTTEPLVTRGLEFATDMAVDLPPFSVGVSLSPETSPHTSRVVEIAVTSEAEFGATLECEKGGWASLLSWQGITVMVVFIIHVIFAWSVIVAIFCYWEMIKVCLHRNARQEREEYPLD